MVSNGDSLNMLGWSDSIVAVVLDANPGEFRKRVISGPWTGVRWAGPRYKLGSWRQSGAFSRRWPFRRLCRISSGELVSLGMLRLLVRLLDSLVGVVLRVNVVFPVSVKCNVLEHAG